MNLGSNLKLISVSHSYPKLPLSSCCVTLGKARAIKGDWRTSSLRAFGKHFQNTLPFFVLLRLPRIDIDRILLLETCLDICILILLERLACWYIVVAVFY